MEYLEMPAAEGIRLAYLDLFPTADPASFVRWIAAMEHKGAERRRERKLRFATLARAFVDVIGDELAKQVEPFDSRSPYHPACVGVYWHALGDLQISLHNDNIELDLDESDR